MDRLSLVALLAFALASQLGCEREKASSSAGSKGAEERTSRSRVNAVQKAPKDRIKAEEFCDVMPDAATATVLELPPLAAEKALERPSQWMWLNIWATWCKPCIEEIPLLVRSTDAMSKEGATVKLQFLSADESDEQVAAFQKTHPDLKSSLRLADPSALEAWMTSLGVAGATLPIHLFADPEGRVRCIRASAIEERDIEGVRDLIDRD